MIRNVVGACRKELNELSKKANDKDNNKYVPDDTDSGSQESVAT